MFLQFFNVFPDYNNNIPEIKTILLLKSDENLPFFSIYPDHKVS